MIILEISKVGCVGFREKVAYTGVTSVPPWFRRLAMAQPNCL